MKPQQVNLRFHAARASGATALRTMALMLAALSMGLLATYGVAWWRIAEIDTALVNGESRARRDADLAASISENLDRNRVATSLADRIETLRRSVARQEQLLAAFNAREVGDPDGFSSTLEALAERHVAGIWLSQISVNSRREVRITGTAVDERLVPRYLESLAPAPAFAGRPLDLLDIGRSETRRDDVAFTLASGTLRTAAVTP